MTIMTTILDLGEEKKHSVRYEERDKVNSVTSTVYVQKAALGAKPYPRALKLTLEVVP